MVRAEDFPPINKGFSPCSIPGFCVQRSMAMRVLTRMALMLALWPAICSPAMAQPTNVLAHLKAVPPFPELRADARKDGIPLEGFSPPSATPFPRGIRSRR